jgi:hypothetical protein
VKPIRQEYIVISKEDLFLTLYDKKNKYQGLRSARIEMVYRFSGDNGFDKVYVYQTERKSSNEEANLTIQIILVLRPEYLTTVDSKDFVSFLKNNDIFEFSLNNENVINPFYIAQKQTQ